MRYYFEHRTIINKNVDGFAHVSKTLSESTKKQDNFNQQFNLFFRAYNNDPT